MKRQYRVRWQRLGMSRPKFRMYESEAPALRQALKLEGRIAEVYPDKDPNAYYCCPGTASYECGCGGRTNAEEWAAHSARVPPLIMGPEVDSREVGEWEHEAGYHPPLVSDAVREAFEEGGRVWPIPDPVPVATAEERVEDIPW